MRMWVEVFINTAHENIFGAHTDRLTQRGLVTKIFFSQCLRYGDRLGLTKNCLTIAFNKFQIEHIEHSALAISAVLFGSLGVAHGEKKFRVDVEETEIIFHLGIIGLERWSN